MNKTSGMLYLVGTPIGNLGDITLRALETLKSVDLIAAEDTRHTQKLLNYFGIDKPLTSYYEYNKSQKGPQLIAEILQGKNIALVSDAGMPGISDPGADLVRGCVDKGIKITVIPGPSALLTGLVASGLDTSGFLYAGFFPRGKKEREELLEKLSGETRTIIFYESPRRTRATLDTVLKHWGDRRCCIARELTKIHEEYLRGTISQALADLEGREVKGEITIIVEGWTPPTEELISWEVVENDFAQAVANGVNKKEAVKEIARKYNLPRRELYNRVMR